MGIAFTIKNFVLDDINSGRVKEIKTDLNLKPRDILLATTKSSTNSFAAETFIKELQQHFKSLNK